MLNEGMTHSPSQKCVPSDQDGLKVTNPLFEPVIATPKGECNPDPADINSVTSGSDGMELAGLPHADEIPSPWVAYDYSQWDPDLWERVSIHDADLYYYHYVQFTVQQAWTEDDWESYYASYPDQKEWLHYYFRKWQTEGGAPLAPLPRIGLPLAGGGVVTKEWLQEAQGTENYGEEEASFTASHSVATGMFEMQGGSLNATSDSMTVPASAQTSEIFAIEAPRPHSPSPQEDCREEPADMQGEQQAMRTSETRSQPQPSSEAHAFSSTIYPNPCDSAAEYPDVYAAPLEPGRQFSHPSVVVHTDSHTAGDTTLAASSPASSYLQYVVHPLVEPSPDDADMWPDSAELRAAVAMYAVDMRDESVAASDDDEKYREMAYGTVPGGAIDQMTESTDWRDNSNLHENVFGENNITTAVETATVDAPGENEEEYCIGKQNTRVVHSWHEEPGSTWGGWDVVSPAGGVHVATTPAGTTPQEANRVGFNGITMQALQEQLESLTTEVEDLRKAITAYEVEKCHLTAALAEAELNTDSAVQRVTAAVGAQEKAQHEKNVLQDQVDSVLAQVKHLEEMNHSLKSVFEGVNNRTVSSQAFAQVLQENLDSALSDIMELQVCRCSTSCANVSQYTNVDKHASRIPI